MARGVTTEWEDMQVRMGGWKAVEKEPTEEDHFQHEQNKLEHYDTKKLMSAAQLEEKAEDDIDFDDDDEFLKEYRAKRLVQLKEDAGRPKFGSVYEINKQQWEEHVTNAPKDVWIVIHLYQDQ